MPDGHEELAVLFARRVLVDEIEGAQVPRGVPDGSRPFPKLEEPDITEIKKRSLAEQFGAIMLV